MSTLLEIGNTGWLHWESTILRLFNDVRITLFDVWDNRQFDSYPGRMSPAAAGDRRAHGALPPGESAEPQQTLQKILQTLRSFDELYELLDFRYILDPSGAA